jgi:UDP-N-acetylmuramate dehydrogenase
VRLGRDFARVDINGEEVQAGGVTPLPQVARTATTAGVRGLEFLVGVPGSVGGGVRQNAGCFGSEIVEVLDEVVIFSLDRGESSEVRAADLEMTYRRSSVKSNEIVLSATLKGWRGEADAGLAQIREHTRWRRLHQPGGTLNAGSVFKNPEGDSAGRIIDSLGLKGVRIGGASVSEKHANFFVAMPGTTASDVYLLVREVARIVATETGIDLEPEIQFVGDFGGGSE